MFDGLKSKGLKKKKNNKPVDKKSKKKRPKEKKEMNKKTKINISIGVFIVLLFIITVILYTNNEQVRVFFDKYIFRKEAYENNLPSIAIESIEVEKIYAYGKNLIVLEENTLKAYNKAGNEEYSMDVKITHPIFDSNGNYLCVADKSGKKVYLISGKNILWQKDLEGEISDICINKNGYIAVSISDTSYKTIVETYDNTGTKLFRRYLSTSDVIDFDISNDNKYLAIAEANFSGVTIQSSINIISIEEAKRNSASAIIYTHKANLGDLIINIEYNNKNNLICMYDGHVDCIKDSRNEELINFATEEILFMDIKLNSSVVKILKKSTGMFSAEAELQIINSNNIDSKKLYIIEEIPQKVYTYNNMIGINLGTEVLFINKNGWLKKRYKSSQEVKDIVLCDNLAGIIYKNKIEIVSF